MIRRLFHPHAGAALLVAGVSLCALNATSGTDTTVPTGWIIGCGIVGVLCVLGGKA